MFSVKLTGLIQTTYVSTSIALFPLKTHNLLIRIMMILSQSKKHSSYKTKQSTYKSINIPKRKESILYIVNWYRSCQIIGVANFQLPNIFFENLYCLIISGYPPPPVGRRAYRKCEIDILLRYRDCMASRLGCNFCVSKSSNNVQRYFELHTSTF